MPWRPPGNRTPTPQETSVCLPFMRRQIALAAPRLLVCLGGSSTQTLLGVKDGITRSRGVWRDYVGEDGASIPALPMFHPAYLLRQPAAKRQAWADLRKLARALEEMGGADATFSAQRGRRRGEVNVRSGAVNPLAVAFRSNRWAAMVWRREKLTRGETSWTPGETPCCER